MSARYHFTFALLTFGVVFGGLALSPGAAQPASVPDGSAASAPAAVTPTPPPAPRQWENYCAFEEFLELRFARQGGEARYNRLLADRGAAGWELVGTTGQAGRVPCFRRLVARRR